MGETSVGGVWSISNQSNKVKSTHLWVELKSSLLVRHLCFGQCVHLGFYCLNNKNKRKSWEIRFYVKCTDKWYEKDGSTPWRVITNCLWFLKEWKGQRQWHVILSIASVLFGVRVRHHWWLLFRAAATWPSQGFDPVGLALKVTVLPDKASKSCGPTCSKAD